MKNRVVAYWISTCILAFIFVSGGICYVLRVPQVVEGVMRLGFPLYFIILLGTWKILGGFAIVVPRFRTLKEWAYAGMFFDLTGAAVASAASSGTQSWHIVAPLAFVPILFASWALRPARRTSHDPAARPHSRQPEYDNGCTPTRTVA
jgi:uncharacterized membrane protein